MARQIVVTVGMGRWPFDRLVRAVVPLCRDHDVFVQTGTSSVIPPCPHERFIDPDDLDRRLREADVVITHAGNSVRLVQRMGRVPIAVARESGRGEMGNDHQVAYLRSEARGPVIVASGDLTDLPDLVDRYDELAAAERARHPVSEPVDAATLRHRINAGLAAQRGLASWVDAHVEHRPGPCLVVTPLDRNDVPVLTSRTEIEYTSQAEHSHRPRSTVVVLDVDAADAARRVAEAAEILALDGLLLLVGPPARRQAGLRVEMLVAVERAGLQPLECSSVRERRGRSRVLLAARGRS